MLTANGYVQRDETGAVKCAKCGLVKGSPGCCK